MRHDAVLEALDMLDQLARSGGTFLDVGHSDLEHDGQTKRTSTQRLIRGRPAGHGGPARTSARGAGGTPCAGARPAGVTVGAVQELLLEDLSRGSRALGPAERYASDRQEPRSVDRCGRTEAPN